MNRDIKFRIKGRDGRWYRFGVYIGKPDIETDPLTLGEFTGLLDKNGKEIFEGDIVRMETQDDDSFAGNTIVEIAEVCYGQHPKAHRFCDYPASFTLYNPNFYDEHGIFYRNRWEYEVIGNIYENPELLTTKSI